MYFINATGQREAEQPLCHTVFGQRGCCARCAGQGQPRSTTKPLFYSQFCSQQLCPYTPGAVSSERGSCTPQDRHCRRQMLVPVPFPSVKQAKQWIQLFFFP